MSYKQTPDGNRIVAERNLLLGQDVFRRTDNGTEQMNIDGRALGTSVDVWDGDGTYWTATGTGSSSSSASHSGTNGWDTGATSDGDGTTWNNGSMIDVSGSYSELSFWIQPKAFPSGSRPRIVWLDGSNVQVGNSLRIDDYGTNMDLDVWQKITIPISDFGLTGNVQKLRMRYLNTDGQQYYIDDIELVPPGGGGPYRFQIAAPDENTIFHISMLVLMLAESGTGWDDDTFTNITALTNGLLLRQRDTELPEDNILWKFNSKDNIDLFGRYHPQESFTFNNGTMMVGFMVKPGKAAINVTDTKVLEFVVRDDLSSIENIRAYAHYGVEVVDG